MSKKTLEKINLKWDEELSFIERIGYKISNDKKLDYLEKAYIKKLLDSRKNNIDEEVKNYNSMGV